MALAPHGRWIRFALYKLDLNQRELAEKLDVSASMLSRMARGKRGVDDRIWQGVAGLLELEMSEYWKGPPA